jgi:hypothetical protein
VEATGAAVVGSCGWLGPSEDLASSGPQSVLSIDHFCFRARLAQEACIQLWEGTAFCERSAPDRVT